ncbi:putative hydrolase [Sphingomonas changbaiensis NBRC 104936]|uniref:Putative hydrolase n=1 Tax=Sphingomonas changbaiensis NBRC 104936 TaxID=1219043 RepID=A0A0E9MQX8_9SPHN|nr:serine hydrolase [Sphingomonas changbaiensis]GAO39944.1 putative hydrolase [Sphingomonas changbaiensis NBRC 104936]
MKKTALLASALALAIPGSAATRDPIAPLFAPDQGDTRAVLLLVDGRPVAKRYAAGYSDANRFISWSMAKSVTALLVGELVADGKLQLDAPAPVAEWRDDARRNITLRQLLHMSSGLRHIEVGQPIESSDTNQVLFVGGTQDMAARAIARPLAFRPGTHFNYDSLTSIILAEIVTRALTDSRDPRVRARAYRDFAEQRLFRPAGVTSAFLEFDGSGTQVGGSLIHMSLDDWGRMGRLLVDGKGPDGTQIVAPDWLAFLKTPAPTNPHYGGHVWLSPNGLVSMRGHLGQFVFTGAKGGHSVVLVRLGNTREDRLESVTPLYERIAQAALPAG